MEEEFKLSIEWQHRLNLKMQEVVRAEVLKLLDVGIAYPILDIHQVSTVHVVHEKEGIVVVPKENNSLFPNAQSCVGEFALIITT